MCVSSRHHVVAALTCACVVLRCSLVVLCFVRQGVAKVVTTAVDVLNAFGITLDELGKILSVPILSGALHAFGALCKVCKAVTDNEENCMRARRRAAILMPTLAMVWRQCSPLSPESTAAIEAITAQLKEQVTLRSTPHCRCLVWQSRLVVIPHQLCAHVREPVCEMDFADACTAQCMLARCG